MHAILKLSIAEITHFVENTEAASIISHGGERMAISVRGFIGLHTPIEVPVSGCSALFHSGLGGGR